MGANVCDVSHHFVVLSGNVGANVNLWEGLGIAQLALYVRVLVCQLPLRFFATQVQRKHVLNGPSLCW